VRRLLAALGDPQDNLPPVIHVAGTNGKGSTIAFLRAMLEEAGYRVHAYTKPHLVRFHERIRLAGTFIDEPALMALLEECEAVNGGAAITYFEITAAAAFLAFARVPADVVLLETGLGGRFDATNVIAHPALTAITPVSLDHQHFLGDTVAAIAREKAGIFKPGAHAVLAPQSAEAAAVLERVAGEIGAPLFRHGHEWQAAHRPDGGLRYEGRRWRLDLPRPGLLGRHQYDNAGTAIACLEMLKGFASGETAIARGLAAVEWPARLQHLVSGPLIAAAGGAELWLDGGHNQAGGEALARVAAEWRGQPLTLVFGMLASHDAAAFLRPFAGLVRGVHTVTVPGEANALSADAAAATATAAGLAAVSHADLASAVAAAATTSGRILICGSLYLAGRVLAENR
jgi:dihydrofolate synthase / folylpolyglutamate synthase